MIAYVDESDGLRYRVRTAASLFLFFVAEGIKLPISGSLGWAKGAVKRHSWTSDGDVTIMVSIVSSVFLLVLLGFRDGWPIEQAEKMILRPPRFCLGATARVRCAMVCGRGRGYCSGRLSLRIAFYRFGRGQRSGQESPQTLPGGFTHHEHPTSSRINSQHIPTLYKIPERL